MHPTSAIRRVYMQCPRCLVMAERPDTPPMPDLRLTSDSRIPTNLGNIIGNCDTCDRPITQYINVAGCDGGNELLCSPCYADYYDDDCIPHDDTECWDDHAATVAKYNLQKLGKQQTLDCGCILMDFAFFAQTDSHRTVLKYEIHLCSDHRIWCEPKILMADVWGSPKDECFHCDEWFSEKTMMLGNNDSKYCLDCYTKIHLAKPICLRCGYYSEGPCLSATGDLCSPKPVNYGVDLS